MFLQKLIRVGKEESFGKVKVELAECGVGRTKVEESVAEASTQSKHMKASNANQSK